MELKEFERKRSAFLPSSGDTEENYYKPQDNGCPDRDSNRAVTE
jgi:hypothetical protein